YRRSPMTANTEQPIDSSARYVLADDSPYLKNMAALWAECPKLATEAEALQGQACYSSEPSKSGEPTLFVQTADDRRVYFHSKHKPREEAERLVDPVETQSYVFYHIHGLGLGYHLELLFERAGDEAVFCVFEPDLLLLRTAFETRDLSKLIESHRVHFFWEMDKADLFVRLMPQSPMITLGTQAVNHAASVQRHSEFHQ